MTRHRIERVNEQFKREVSRVLISEVKDPRVAGVTVTRAVTAPDLTLTRIYVLVAGDEAERREAMKGLRKATPFIRTLVGRTLDLRRVPEMRFEEDRNTEHAQRIERLLRDAGAGGDGGE